jgi:hypothetical protein
MMLTADDLRAELHYDPSAGVFIRKRAAGGARVGDVAGGASTDGYTSVSIRGVRYRAARLAYLWMTGQHPSGDIDHVNRDRRDDRWENLRLATRAQNLANTGARSGMKGACWVAAKGKWKAQIRHGGKNHHLGYFDRECDAHEAYARAAREAHGAFAAAA